ncbi:MULTISPECIES: hypothetical protein [unclassified Microbacterium]|uniref:hypothetical protein n=1 Tax=unclassified Microbacterium TaxID=2609290 RepID=UPI001E5EF507|nr:hypothetical protein [Microbacterium sp. Au-Mic1]MCE4027722.1 hypothetical protein [Microbacterium sp. Au-Mic1]
MSMMTPTRFEMRRLTENEWLILDDSFDRTDARHTVACVTRVSVEQVEVVWLRPVTERIRYGSVADVLEAVSNAPSGRPLADGST